MNYERIYNLLIQKRQNILLENGGLGMSETHHIVPRCFGGTNDLSNLVELTPREHFLAHLLLAKMYPDSKVAYAAWLMACLGPKRSGLKVTSHRYQFLRREHAGRVSSNENIKVGVQTYIKGKKQSPEHIRARVEARKAKGAWHSEETKQKISTAHKQGYEEGLLNPIQNLSYSEETHAKGVTTRKANGSYNRKRN